MFRWLRNLVSGHAARFGASVQEAPSANPTVLGTPPPDAKVTRQFFNTVAGVSYRNPDGTPRQEIIRRAVRAGLRLRAQLEDDNPVDPCAVALFTPDGQQIGYLNAATAMDVRDHVARGRWVEITVADTTGGYSDKPTMGVNIHVTVYEIPSEPLHRTADFRAQVAELERSKNYGRAEVLLLGDVAKREGLDGAVTAVSSWPYERLANIYRKQKRFADEAAILGRYFALPETRRVAFADRLLTRLYKVTSQLPPSEREQV